MEVHRITPNCVDDLERAFCVSERLAGFVFEPIQGEAGVRPLEKSFVQRIAAMCRHCEIPLIADECQTGLGRTGSFLDSHYLGIQPDYVVLSKSLGGGIDKIAATLIDRNRYRAEFDLLHTSTFADDGFSCAIALATLERLDDRLIAQCRDFGLWMKSNLDQLVGRFPRCLREVRGRGLLLGLELRSQQRSKSFVLRYLDAHGLLGLVISAYLLHVHRLRVAPTLSDPLTLRLQPAAMVSPSEVEMLLQGLVDVCEHLERDDAVGLTRFLLDADHSVDFVPRTQSQPVCAVRHTLKTDRRYPIKRLLPRVA